MKIFTGFWAILLGYWATLARDTSGTPQVYHIPWLWCFRLHARKITYNANIPHENERLTCNEHKYWEEESLNSLWVDAKMWDSTSEPRSALLALESVSYWSYCTSSMSKATQWWLEWQQQGCWKRRPGIGDLDQLGWAVCVSSWWPQRRCSVPASEEVPLDLADKKMWKRAPSRLRADTARCRSSLLVWRILPTKPHYHNNMAFTVYPF